MPEAARHCRDPIVLRARFEWDSEPSGAAPNQDIPSFQPTPTSIAPAGGDNPVATPTVPSSVGIQIAQAAPSANNLPASALTGYATFGIRKREFGDLKFTISGMVVLTENVEKERHLPLRVDDFLVMQDG